MSHRSTRSNEDLTEINRADLFKTPPATKRRINTKKTTQKTPSTSDTEQEEEHESPLGRFADNTPRPPKPLTMAESSAQDEIRRLREQLAQAEAIIADQYEPVDPEDEDQAP
jgi:hypothetical protein